MKSVNILDLKLVLPDVMFKEVNNSRLKLRACGNKQPALEMDY